MHSQQRVSCDMELVLNRAFRSELLIFTSFGCGRQALDVTARANL